jgi:hypothetical protein
LKISLDNQVNQSGGGQRDKHWRGLRQERLFLDLRNQATMIGLLNVWMKPLVELG